MSYDKQERMSALEESDEVFYAKMQKGCRGYMSKLNKKNKKSKKSNRKNYKIESLEPRLLMDASVNDWCTVVVLE
jgi:hypothetical protein